ncbi:MAG: hypothetical protein ACXACX_20155 [Candidatus Hodarchaeales archaeon]
MVLYQSGNPLGDPMRVITIYLAQMLVCLWDAYLAYCILKRDRKRLNFIFAGFYLFGVIGNIFNFIYGPIPIVEVVLILNFLTNFFLYFSPIFFVVFELMLLKSEKYINTKKQLLILIGYGILMFCMIFFVITPDWGVYINPKWQPVWSLPIFLYVIIGESIFAVGPVLYLSYRAYECQNRSNEYRNYLCYCWGIFNVYWCNASTREINLFFLYPFNLNFIFTNYHYII